jgi:ubiquitin-protein ligase
MLHNPSGGIAAPLPWSSAQVIRLEYEWHRLQRAFAFHPHVAVTPLGDPPGEYQVNYRVTTLSINEAGQLAYVTTFPVHVWLPPQFPHAAPVVRPMAAPFHPNVTAEWFHLNPAWHPDASLADVIVQSGRLLAFQTYDPGAVADPVAINWVYANPHLLPTDAAADFSPDAGGDPLSRIVRFGPGALADLHGRIELMIDRLSSGGPPPAGAELEQLARDARVALGLFLEPDVPESLRASAEELQELVDSTGGPAPVWSAIGRQVERSKAVAEAAREVERAEDSLRRALSADAPPPPHAGPADPPQRVPPTLLVRPLALALRRGVREADKAVGRLRKVLAQLGAAPRIPAPGARATLVTRRLNRELARLAAAAEPARASGTTLASLDPVLHRARRESAAVDRLAAWADHAELLRRGDELVERTRATGPAALQAYTTEGAGGRGGPFEYEQRVEPAAGPAIAVWNLRGSIVRVVDAATEEVVAQGDGRVSVPPPHPPGGPPPHPPVGPPAPLVVHAAAHTDEVRVQLEYLLTQAREALHRLRPGEEEAAAFYDPATWAGRLVAELDQPDDQQAAGERHHRSSQAWKHLLADLVALGRYKQRLATYHLLARLAESVPRLKAERERLGGIIARADARLSEIGARSGRDAETAGVIVPQHYAAEYSEHLAERDRARQEIDRIDQALVNVAARARHRLGKPRLLGSPETVPFRLLPPMPQSELKLDVSDESIRRLAARLEALLGTPLGQPNP